jgi:hypothetical protein
MDEIYHYFRIKSTMCAACQISLDVHVLVSYQQKRYYLSTLFLYPFPLDLSFCLHFSLKSSDHKGKFNKYFLNLGTNVQTCLKA